MKKKTTKDLIRDIVDYQDYLHWVVKYRISVKQQLIFLVVGLLLFLVIDLRVYFGISFWFSFLFLDIVFCYMLYYWLTFIFLRLLISVKKRKCRKLNQLRDKELN